MSWWDRATTDQKLEQIDAGIALGMTGKQISMCLRVPDVYHGNSKVTAFAHYHGRSFPTSHKASGKRAGEATRETYKLLLPRRSGTPEHMINGAFDIFEQGGMREELSFGMEAAE
jgi:hypothetical protein